MADIHDVDPGQMIVTRLDRGRFLIEIGRARYVKRVNLSADEAREVVRHLAAMGVEPQEQP
jgi:hypothetical protein